MNINITFGQPELQIYEQVLNWASVWVPLFSVIFAVWSYYKYYKKNRFDIMEKSFDALQRINEQALESDKNLLAAIQSGNPLDKTTKDEARIIYFWYMRINRIFRAYEYRRGRFISQNQADRIMYPAIGTLKSAMPKINAILERGYPEDFTEWLVVEIEESKAPELISEVPTFSTKNDEVAEDLLKIISDSDRTPKERRAYLMKLIKHQADAKNQEVESTAKTG